MSFKSFYSIQKETNVTQGIIPLKCKTSSGCYVTAELGNVTFRNLCKAPSVGDAASLLTLVRTLLPKQLPETPTFPQPPSPVPGQCLLVTQQCQVVYDTFVHKSRDDNISCPENWPLSLLA